jgi:hypothetical protein
VKEYDLYLPLRYNDGTLIEPRKFRAVQVRLLEFFNGYTFFPQPKEGVWQMGDVVFHDEIVIYRVVSNRPRQARQFMKQLKQELMRAFKQEEIFMIEREVERL